MPHKKALDFLERMKSDEAFNKAVNRIEDLETKMAYIEKQGYRFNADELEEASSLLCL